MPGPNTNIDIPETDCFILRTNFYLGKPALENPGFMVVDADISDLFSRVDSPQQIRPSDIEEYATVLIPSTKEVFVYDGRSLYSVEYVEQHYLDTPKREDNPSRMAWYTSGAFYLETESCTGQDIAERLGLAPAAVYTAQSPTVSTIGTTAATPTASVQTAFQQRYGALNMQEWVAPLILSGVVLLIGLYLIFGNRRQTPPDTPAT